MKPEPLIELDDVRDLNIGDSIDARILWKSFFMVELDTVNKIKYDNNEFSTIYILGDRERQLNYLFELYKDDVNGDRLTFKYQGPIYNP